VEVELEIQSKNDCEYLLFEDMKPSGFERMLKWGYNESSTARLFPDRGHENGELGCIGPN
jgi:hypothetical protein